MRRTERTPIDDNAVYGDLDKPDAQVIYRQFLRRIESRNGLHTLEYAQQIGLGSRTYRLVSLDH